MSDIDHTYDDDEDFDASDHGPVSVDDDTSAELLRQQLAHLEAAGFPPGPTTLAAD